MSAKMENAAFAFLVSCKAISTDTELKAEKHFNPLCGEW